MTRAIVRTSKYKYTLVGRINGDFQDSRKALLLVEKPGFTIEQVRGFGTVKSDIV